MCFSNPQRWAREHIFDPHKSWAVHLRVDSSPQFNRDYLVSEADVIDLTNLYSAQWPTAFSNLQIHTRLLPIQVLGRRATNTSYKYRALLRALHLETGDVNIIKERARSFLHDMGTESRLAMVPELDASSDGQLRAFRYTLPFHDLDHGMHHVMQELVGCWPEAGELFDKQLRALSKYFAKKDQCQRFCKTRIWDSNMPSSAKNALSKIMMITCPVFIHHRWQYRFEVLSWVCEREQLLSLLDPASVTSDREDGDEHITHDNDFTDNDVEALKLLYSSSESCTVFWTMAQVMLVLCRWGHRVTSWLHGCWCHPTEKSRQDLYRETHRPCKWNGRRLVELASGKAVHFIHNLKNLSIERDKFASEKLTKMRGMNDAVANQIVAGFVLAKKMLESRFLQLTSFMQEAPWNLVKLLRYLIVPEEEANSAMEQSRTEAAIFLADYKCGKLKSIGDVGKEFLEKRECVGALSRWATKQDVHMGASLFKELVSYSTSLVVMQRLEAKHHLVHVP